MEENIKNVRDLKTKKPFRRIVPEAMAVKPTFFRSGNEPQYDEGTNSFMVVTQADFLREYYPTGHAIYDHNYYPDIWRVVDEPVYDRMGNPAYDADGNQVIEAKYYCERVPRYAFPYQQIIALNHIIHATGNDIQHELSVSEPTAPQQTLFDKMTSAWLAWGMEEYWYESFKAREITADAAFVATLDEYDNLHTQVLSFQKGDILYPHYDMHGELKLFARCTHQYDEDGNETKEIIEVWDNTTYRVYKANAGKERTIVDRIKGFIGLSGYELVEEQSHGFNFVPVSYTRDDDGPGWTPSQDGIDCYELSFSQMAHNNQAFGEAILVLRSKGEMPPNITRGLSGSIKEIDLGEEDEAKFLEGQSASESYMNQLSTTDEMIYRGSNCVKTPSELKSGDTPASAIKLLFAPSLNQAMADGNECKPFIAKMWKIFAYAYGKKNNCLVDAMALPVVSWVKPFVHLSESAIAADLVALVGAKVISRQTAAERASFYSKPGEMERINKEAKVERDMDLLYEYEQLKNENKFSNKENGGDGTGSNWDNWNASHRK